MFPNNKKGGGFNNTGAVPKQTGTSFGVLQNPYKPVTATVPGTQNNSGTTVNPFSATQRIAAQGTPTAAARSDLQGKKYFDNLAKSTNPSEQQAGQIGLKNPAVGTNPGVLPTKTKPILEQFGSGNRDVKTITQPDGTKIDLYSDQKKEETKPTPTSTSSTPPSTTTPQVGSPSENAQNVLNSGNQTDLEKERMQKLDQAGQQSPDERAATNAVAYGLGVKNNNTFGQYAGAGQSGEDPQSYVNEANAPDLAGRAAGTRGLANAYTNLYGTQAQAYLNSAQAAAGRGLSASESGLSAAQTQAGRAQGSAENVFGASLPGQISGSTRTYNPLDPTGTSTIQSGVQNEFAYTKGLENKQLQSELDGLAANSDLLTNTINKAGTNSMNLSYANFVNQLAQKNFSQPEVAAFQAMVQQLQAQGITISPETKLSAIKAELDAQKAQKQNQITANQKNIQSSGSTSSGGSTGGTGKVITTPGGLKINTDF